MHCKTVLQRRLPPPPDGQAGPGAHRPPPPRRELPELLLVLLLSTSRRAPGRGGEVQHSWPGGDAVWTQSGLGREQRLGLNAVQFANDFVCLPDNAHRSEGPSARLSSRPQPTTYATVGSRYRDVLPVFKAQRDYTSRSQ